jgi:recombination protein RecT
MNQELLPYQAAIQNSEERFKRIAGQMVNFDKESLFAMQALVKNDYSMKIANQAPKSVLMAMFNVASTGLTLNPAHGYAYLVPRDGEIKLDISYKGLIKIATDTGAVLWARADVEYAKDEFEYNGPAAMPLHKANVFSKDRGEIVGAYCIAKTKDADILCEVLPMDEILQIRSKSTAFTKGSEGKRGPWEDFFTQMAKKAVIKRASKTWPYTETTERLLDAIEIANAAEGGYTFESDNSVSLPDDRRKRCDEAAEQYGPSIATIKDRIAKWDADKDPDHLWTVAETWAGIPQAAQMDLWLAPTKGGVFTTHERDVIKTKLPREEPPQALSHNPDFPLPGEAEAA